MLREALINPLGSTDNNRARGAPQWLLLPVLCSQVVGGDSASSCQVAAAWVLLYTSAHLFDKIEDDEASGWIRELGIGPSINVATGLMASAFGLLNQLSSQGVTPEIVEAVIEDYHQTVMLMCGGQHKDLTEAKPSLEECWSVAEAKSGAFFALACRSGARLATDCRPQLESFSSFGHHIGMMVQIRNDIGGIWERTGEDNDLFADHWSIPLAYAMAVGSRDEKRSLTNIIAPPAEFKARIASATKMLEDMGVDLYLAAKLEQHRAEAVRALSGLAGEGGALDALTDLLSQLTTFHIIPDRDYEQ